MTVMDWIKIKCRNGLIFLGVYGLFIFGIYSATIPPDRSGEGLCGAVETFFGSFGHALIMMVLLVNPAACFLIGRALTAIVICLIFRILSERGDDVEQYSKEVRTAMIAVPVFCIFVPGIYAAFT